ncbi:MAG: PEP-CTERM sorting domain-containing protein [Gemmataceae bacterium]|nr:PEP-CTERM sorting domain-containing protein [Gemmataceae bacterium]
MNPPAARSSWFSALVAGACLALLAAPEQTRADIIISETLPTTVTFNFNSLSPSANNAAVRDYLNSIWSAAGLSGMITVSGAEGERDYTGDNHVVGPVNGSTVTPYTLGNTDGGVFHGGAKDVYLVNSMRSSGDDKIVLTFPVPLTEASFDYQIFPNGDGREFPDFTFLAGTTSLLHTLGVDPAGGPFPHSPDSGISRVEQSPQFLGVSGALALPPGTTQLTFQDWPEMIGIDNLTIRTAGASSAVPEPSSLVILAASVGGLLVARRARRAR